MKVIKALKEVAPESKVVVSKTIPIGDQKLDIERNVFNASIAKELSEDSEVNVSFLDHGNLAEQALPIKNYYRQDMVHLAPDGIDVFSTNLRRMINEVLKKNVGPDENSQRKDINNNSNFSGRSNVYHYRDDNRDSNSKGSTGHQESYYGNRKDYQHREYNRDRNWRNSNRNTYPGSNNGYPYRGEYRGNENISHRNTNTGNHDDYHTYRDDERGQYENSGHRTFTGNRDDNRLWGVERGTYENSGHCTLTGKRDDYRFRDDERGHYESSGHHRLRGIVMTIDLGTMRVDITITQAVARLPGIAVATNTGTMRGDTTRTHVIAIRFQKFVMATKTGTMRNIQVTIIILGRDIVSVREDIMKKDVMTGLTMIIKKMT